MIQLSELSKIGGSRQYDEESKRMAVALADAKVSLNVTAEELGITPQILTRWRRERLSTQKAYTSGRVVGSQEQQEILRLKKESKQAELERDILKSVYSAYAVE